MTYETSAGPPTWTVLLAVLATGAGCGDPPRLPGASTSSSRPNVLLVTVDTLRADRLGCLGHAGATTPNIDRLAAEGTTFVDASTCIPRTTQSIASIFTGRYPHEHGVLELGMPLAEQAQTLADVLGAAGYRTAGISANPVAGRNENLHQGFESFVDPVDFNLRRFIRERREPSEVAGAEVLAEQVVDEALSFIGKLDGADPWFVWLLPFDPHWPYDPPPPYNQVVDRDNFTFYDELPRLPRPNATTFFNLDGRAAEMRPTLSRLYDAELTYVDAMLGRLFDALDRQEGARDTLIVLTADHGESLGDHGYFYEHGDFVYDATLRVPLIFHWPGTIAGGRRLDPPVSTLDLFPTIVALAGTQPGVSDLAGRNLAPVLRGQAPAADGRILLGESGSSFRPQNPRRAIGGSLTGLETTERYLRHGGWVVERRRDTAKMLLYDATADPTMLHDVAAAHADVVATLGPLLEAISPLKGRWRTARDERWKLIRAPESDGVRFELYDLSGDPGETRDLAQGHPAQVDRLRGPLEDWIASMDLESIPIVPHRAEVDERQLTERLRALGYVD